MDGGLGKIENWRTTQAPTRGNRRIEVDSASPLPTTEDPPGCNGMDVPAPGDVLRLLLRSEQVGRWRWLIGRGSGFVYYRLLDKLAAIGDAHGQG